MKRSSTGQFKPTPKDQKTSAMLKVEARLGRTLEEDFQEFHVEKGWGQKRMAQRWETQRATIFATNKRGGRRSWVQMLALPVRRDSEGNSKAHTGPSPLLKCEICSHATQSLDNAHWVSARDQGSTASYNILRLCPNCHRLLDRDHPTTIKLAMEILLFRVVKKIIESGPDTEAKRAKLALTCEAIINRKPL
jgi:hypothetical protein